MRLLKQRGQSMGEYAVLFAIVLGAVVGLQGYIRTRLRAKIAGATDAYSKMGSGLTIGDQPANLSGASTAGGTTGSASVSALSFTSLDVGDSTSGSTSTTNFDNK